MTLNQIHDQLAKLPFRAVVAIATRYAMRVQPLTHSLPGSGPQAVEEAISLAKMVANGSVMDQLLAAAPLRAIERDLESTNPASGIAARVAAFAARAAGFEISLFKEMGDDEAFHKQMTAIAIEYAMKALTLMIHAAETAAWDFAISHDPHSTVADASESFTAESMLEIVQRDLYKLSMISFVQSEGFGEPVDPSSEGPLGSLWPSGLPGWLVNLAIKGQEPGHLILEAEVSEYADTEEVAEALADLGYALNAYHIASGGNGLVIDEWEVFVPSAEPVEVES